MGQAKVVHCCHTVSSTADLIEEAEHLWKAEQPSADAGRIAADWGCVALLCNPDRKVPEDLLRAWAEPVEREPNYGRVSQTQEEGILVSKDGLLQIDWPRRVEGGEPVSLDLLLVTANDPRITVASPTYPSIQTIANAWNQRRASMPNISGRISTAGYAPFRTMKYARSCGPEARSRDEPR